MIVNEGVEACLLYPATGAVVVLVVPDPLLDPVVRINPDQIPVVRSAIEDVHLLRGVGKDLRRMTEPQSDSIGYPRSYKRNTFAMN